MYLDKTEFLGVYSTFPYEVISGLISQVGLDRIRKQLLLDLVTIRIVDDLRRNGFSKDNKSQQPQILVALMVTKEGLPIAYWIFSGNTFEGHTIIPVVNAFYTTNIIESLNSSIRKYTKTKTVFPDDQSALKAVYLAVNNVQQKWTLPIRSWGMIINQFIIKFEHKYRI